MHMELLAGFSFCHYSTGLHPTRLKQPSRTEIMQAHASWVARGIVWPKPSPRDTLRGGIMKGCTKHTGRTDKVFTETGGRLGSVQLKGVSGVLGLEQILRDRVPRLYSAATSNLLPRVYIGHKSSHEKHPKLHNFFNRMIRIILQTSSFAGH